LSEAARSFHVDSVSLADIGPILRANIDRESRQYTDEMPTYKLVARDLASHEMVNHGREEYASRRRHHEHS
jgi:hypothetical protein